MDVGKAYNVYNLGKIIVTAGNNDSILVGGISGIGFNNATYDNCHNTGSLIINSDVDLPIAS